jgi:hypothetical protein
VQDGKIIKDKANIKGFYSILYKMKGGSPRKKQNKKDKKTDIKIDTNKNYK